MKALFILKKNTTYGFHTAHRRSAGLWNSTRYIVEALQEKGVECEIIEVIDNNCIDRWVSIFNPEIVIIEALWVVPEKFDVLKDLHPNVKWFVHLHSHMAFLAIEGISVEWINGYVERGIGLIANSSASYNALRSIVPCESIRLLHNVYVPHFKNHPFVDKPHIDIACLGAIRPLKNHLLQATAAIKFGEIMGLPVNFHVNSSRVETGGEPVLKCLRSLFQDSVNTLVEMDWLEPKELHHYLKRIDVGMQVSLSETFSVVTANYLDAGVPIVVSKEVCWVSRFSIARDDDINDIVRVMNNSWKNRMLLKWNQRLLRKFSCHAIRAWYEFITHKEAR